MIRTRHLAVPFLACGAALALPALALPAPARAEGPVSNAPNAPLPADPKEAARAKAALGLTHFEASRWPEAYAAFAEADSLFHVNTLTLAMAQCQERMGKLLAARDLYRRVASEPVPPTAEAPIRKAQSTATASLESLALRIPKLVLTLRGQEADRARVQIDGLDIPLSEVAIGRELDPGDHVVTAETEGGLSARLAVPLPEGATTRAELVLRPAPVAAEKPAPRGSLLPAGVAIGIGSLSLAAGAAMGVISIQTSDDIRSRCRTIAGDLHCQAADIPARDTGRTLATGSTIALVAGGAAFVTGAVLGIVRPGGEQVQVSVTPTSIELRARF
ncbi:MAG: hypothetical protein R3B70_46275 [Polyangiaceae bacterium]